MGDPENGGEGGHEEGGFMSEGFEHGLETVNNIRGRISQGLDLTAVPNVMKAYNAVSAFTGGPMSLSTIGNTMENASEAIKGGEGIMGRAGSAMGGKLLPGIGTGLSVAGMAMDGMSLANTIQKEGFSNAYHDSNAYNSAGGMALNAAHAVLPWLGPYGEAANLALTGGELAADGAGKAAGWGFGKNAEFSANSVAGGLIRGTFGDQSAGEQVRQGIGNVFGHGGVANAVGVGADVLTNSALFLPQLGTTIGRGIVNEGGAIINGIANGDGVIGGALNHAGHAVANGASTAANWVGNQASNAGHAIANGASAAANWAGNTASNAGHAIANGASAAANWAGNTASNAGHAIANGASAAANWAGNTASNIGSGISNAASSATHAVGGAVDKVLSW